MEDVDACWSAPTRIGQARAVADELAIDEDRHVPAQRRLVVEHVAARLRVRGEDVVQHLAHGAPGASVSGQATWRWMFGVKTTLAIEPLQFRCGRVRRFPAPRRTRLRLPLGERLEVREPLLELAADHLVHVAERSKSPWREGLGPCIAQVTRVAPVSGASTNSTRLCASIGLFMSSCIAIFDDGTDSVISTLPDADIAVAAPVVRRADAARRSAVGELGRRIQFQERIPAC